MCVRVCACVCVCAQVCMHVCVFASVCLCVMAVIHAQKQHGVDLLTEKVFKVTKGLCTAL